MAAAVVRLALRASTTSPLGLMPSSRLVLRVTGHRAATTTAAAVRRTSPPVACRRWAAPRPVAPPPLVVPGAAAAGPRRRFASLPTKVCGIL